MLPILNAGLADLMESNHTIHDEICLVPTPNQHPTLSAFTSKDKQAIITSDIFHRRSKWPNPAC